MATPPASNRSFLVVDANIVIAVCADEREKVFVARTVLAQYLQNGAVVCAPGVLLSECLHVLCRKLMDGHLTVEQHGAAIRSLHTYVGTLAAVPVSDFSLAERAEELRGAYGCSRSADAIYIALAEQLAQHGAVELLTFDADLPRQAAAAPVVTVRLLIPQPPSP